MTIKLICIIIFFAFLVVLIGSLVKALVVIKSMDKGVSRENLEDYIEQLEVIKTLSALERQDLDSLFRVSRNPWNFNKTTWILLKYVASICLLIMAILSYGVFKDILITGVLGLATFFAYWYPTSHYKNVIVERERSWNKMYSHVWRISNLLDDYDPKKVCVEMKDYFEKIGESELALGFSAFYDMWPDDFNSIPEALEEFEKYFPFDIPKDLFFVLLECWRNSSPANERLDNFRKNCELRYEKFSNEVLSKVPSKATMLSLPFLMISVMAAILFPALLNILKALG